VSTGRDYAPRSEDFVDRVVMVTGSTRGIGKAVATALVKLGATVILHGKRSNALDRLYH
jgi:NADP-dependent 3-hydroxy acid dehydrogenase YdfG